MVPHDPDMGFHVAPQYWFVLLQKVGLNLILVILWVLFNIFWRFCPFLGDIGPFSRPDLGRKLGDGYQIQAYLNQAFLKPWRRFIIGLCCQIFEPKAIFMQGSY
jgi:hypothetical protein